MRPSFLVLLALAMPLGGCEPLRGVISEKELGGSVDVACIDATLRKTFGKVQRWDYVGDGKDYPRGTNVAQLAYFHTDHLRGWATLEIGEIGSATRFRHSFTGIGAKLPEQDFPPAFRAMKRATAALRAACKLNLGDMQLRTVGQHVEALERASPEGS